MKPQDTYVLAGQVATLNCSTSSTEDVHWYYGTSYTYVYAGRKLISPFNNRLKVEVYQNDGTTAFNLVFLSTQPVDAGTYICGDIQGRGETSSAEMTVFTTGSCTAQSVQCTCSLQNNRQSHYSVSFYMYIKNCVASISN